MMKINTPILILTAIAAAAIGCNKASAPEAPFDPVVRVAPEVTPQTRGSYTTETLKEFDLFIHSANSKYSYTNTKFTKNATSGEWEPARQMLWEGKKTGFDFLAIAPSQASGLSMTDDPIFVFEVETVQTKESTASDLLWAFKSGTSCEDTDLFDSEGKMKIAFNHALSKLKVQFTLGTEFNHNGVPQSNPVRDVKIGKFKTQTGIKINNNKFDPVWPTGDAKTIQAYEESWTKAVDETGRDDKTKNCVAVFECILPQQNWDEFTVNFICGGKPYTYTANSGGDGLFESGKNYTLPLTVGKDEVIAGEITATPWADGGTSDLETD